MATQITLILGGFFGIVAFVNVPEVRGTICRLIPVHTKSTNHLIFTQTFAPVLLVHRAKRLRSETGNAALYAKHEENTVNFKDIVNRYLLRPTKMLCLEPILALMTIYLSFVFGEFDTNGLQRSGLIWSSFRTAFPLLRSLSDLVRRFKRLGSWRCEFAFH